MIANGDIKTEEQKLAKMRSDQAEAARTTGAQVNSDIRNEPHTPPPPVAVGGRRRRKRSSKKAKKSKKSKKSRKSKKRTGRRRRH